MTPDFVVTSLQNPRIKHAIRLRKRSARAEEKLLLIEGYPEVKRAGDNHPDTLPRREGHEEIAIRDTHSERDGGRHHKRGAGDREVRKHADVKSHDESAKHKHDEGQMRQKIEEKTGQNRIQRFRFVRAIIPASANLQIETGYSGNPFSVRLRATSA